MNRRLGWTLVAALCLCCATPRNDLPEIDSPSGASRGEYSFSSRVVVTGLDERADRS